MKHFLLLLAMFTLGNIVQPSLYASEPTTKNNSIKNNLPIALNTVENTSEKEQMMAAVTFSVDMQGQTVSPNGVHIAGDFQQAAGYPANWVPGTTMLTNTGGGSVYSITLNIPDGTYNYKFINGNMWGSDESVPAACAVGGNRAITIAGNTTIPTVCYGQCAACPAQTYSVTFKVDMGPQTVGANGMFVAGSFQGWNATATPMTNTSGTTWEVTVPNISGNIEYKFVNSGNWESVPGTCATNSNRGANITANTTLSSVCFGQCGACPAQTYSVTLKVDMQGQTVSPNGVHVAGSFQGWNPGATALTNTSGTIWEVTVPNIVGSIEYKFVNGNVWGSDESVPATCATNNNRGATITANTTIPTVCYAQCVACPATSYAVTFKVDMQGQTVSPNGVHIAGSFQGWNPGATPLTNTSGTIWEVTVQNISGNIEYKFINGNMWGSDESVPAACATNGNRGANITAVTTIPTVCFAQCAACTPSVTFSVDMSNQTVSPNGVHIAGSFQQAAGFPNNWDPATTLLTAQGNGIYSVTLNIPAGNYEYKFVNGNNWGSDESVPGACATNGNRSVTVNAGANVITAVCYAQCGACPVTHSVTFKVDMQGQTVSPNGVHVAGSFQGWNPGATALTNTSGTIWEVTVPNVSAGNIEYKFVNGNTWGSDEGVPGACATNGNRGASISANTVLPVVCFAQCAACPTITYSVTFKVDMQGRTVSPNGVHVAGSFQGWNPGATSLTNTSGTIWEVTVPNIAGNIEYKFINGNQWGPDESIPSACATNGNRGATITANTVLPVVCFTQCGACPLITYSATFSVDMTGKTVSSNGVHIAGNFQGWNPSGTPLADQGNGIWAVTINGLNGPIEYKFINGNQWGPGIDESVPATCAVNNNRAATISANTTIPVVCFEQCTACAIVANITNIVRPTCYGQNDGAATATVNGGSGCNPSFLWSNGATTATISNVLSGLYSVTITCGTQSTVLNTNIIEPAQLQLVLPKSTQISCSTPGTVNITAIGGSGTIGYLWSNGATTATASVTNPASYGITVTDANGCVASASVNATADQSVPKVTLSSNKTVIDCITTSITIDGSNATSTGSLNYLWSNGATSTAITVSAAGDYKLTVTSANGCSSVANLVLTEDKNVATATIGGGNEVCKNATTILSVTGAQFPAYLWSNGNTTSSASVSDGVHSVTVTAANGCTASYTTTVTLSPDPIITIATDLLTCIKKTVQINATTISNLSSTVWSGPNNFSNTTLSPTVNSAGNYSLEATTDKGCKATFVAIVQEDTKAPILTLAASKVKFCEADSVTITANSSQEVTYIWNNGTDKATIVAKSTNTYHVSVTGVNGCQSHDSIKVEMSPKMLPTIVVKLDCQNNAKFLCAPNGGTAAFAYLWGDGTTSNSVQLKAPNTAKVTITDAFGCSATATATATAITPLAITATIIDEINNDGKIVVAAAGGTAPYTYLWGTGNQTATIQGIKAGKYCVTVTDANDCSKTECFDVKKTIGTEDNHIANAIKVYPNPTADVLFLTVAGSLDIISFELIDINGRILQQYNGTERQIATDNLNQGIYLLKCNTKEGYAIKQIVKM